MDLRAAVTIVIVYAIVVGALAILLASGACRLIGGDVCEYFAFEAPRSERLPP